MARMLKQVGQNVPDQKPILEVNAEHALVKKLEASASDDTRFNDLANILFDQAHARRRRLPGRSGGLRETGECVAGVTF